MNYNAIQMREAIDKLIDRVKSPRFTDDRYYEAINQAQKLILDGRVEPIKVKRDFSFQSSERLRNELRSLVVPTVNGTITGSSVAFPTNFYYLLLMQNTVNGEKNVCKPITFNEKGTLRRNPFKEPISSETYYSEDNASWKIELPINASFTLCEIDYLKNPDVVSIGKEKDKITATLAIGTNYTVYNQAVHAGVTYYEGESFTATSTVLTSGVVIPTSVIVNSDMPEYLHDEIIRLSAAIMNGTVEDYNKQQNLMSTNEIS